MELKKRHKDALKVLREQCDYLDSRPHDDTPFAIWSELIGAQGPQTHAELVAAGLAMTGKLRDSKGIGHRITAAGRLALDTPAPPKPPRSHHRPLKMLQPKIRTLGSPLGKK